MLRFRFLADSRWPIPSNTRFRWIGFPVSGNSLWGYESTEDIDMAKNAINNFRDFYLDDWDFGDLTIPDLPIIVPLTLLSAYLILWKPRKKMA